MTRSSRPEFLCGHCGSRHATISKVRDCSTDSPVSAVALNPDWSTLAGPDALGRSLVVSGGMAIPEPWARCERVLIPTDTPNSTIASSTVVASDILDQLQDAYSRRRRLVIECASPSEAPVGALDTQLADLDPHLELPGDRLDHLIFSNSIDARDPRGPTFRMVDLAIASGAVPAGPETRADVLTDDGSKLWCDGGPLESFTTDLSNGVPVVPRIHLMSGSLRPLVHCLPDAELAPDQLEAVATSRGGARIVAPAGSGKTRVLTERARHLVRGMGVTPSAVCLLAFNVRARQEMQERTTDLPGLEVRTINSLALAIGRGTGPFTKPRRANVTVIDERRVRDHIRALVKIPRRAMTDPFAAWIEAFTACRLGLRDPAEVEQVFDGDVPDLPRVMDAYRHRLAESGEVDFDEQIIRAIEIIAAEPLCRVAARIACGVLLVDEFQDLTPAHLLLIRLLAGPAAEVFGVGDDDQTVYGYAGASPSWLINFAQWFPGSAAHDLHINYRCAPEVIQAAQNLLSHNRRRVPKRIQPPASRNRPLIGTESGPDPMQQIVTDDQLGALTGTVNAMLTDGVPAKKIAVLTRVNATLLAPMLTLRASGVATTTPVDTSYLNRTGVAAAMAWLRLATAPESSLPADAMETAARRPPRGISPMVAGWIGEQRSVTGLDRLAGRLHKPRDRRKVEELASEITSMRELVSQGADTTTMLCAVRDTTGLGRALESRLDASRRSLDRSSHGDDLDALVSVAHLQPNPTEFPEWLAAQLDGPRGFGGHGVRLSTIHRVKGMEWPRVIVYGVNVGSFPHRLSSDEEEERRILHVAITRSSEQTVVIAGPSPSRFLAELSTTAPPSPPEPFNPAGPRRESRHNLPLSGDAETLFEALRGWRSRISRTAGVPAYVVFDNRTLKAISLARPTNLAELLAISGIGPVKLERYGHEVLEIVSGG